MTETILIVGAGIAGLSAGCYAQMNGYRSRIFELHTLPGGLCTSWRRGDYVFDGAIRYLSGVSPQSRTHQLWEELGLLQGREIYYYDEFVRFEGADGRTFILYTDIDRLEQHMLELAPRDREPIADFVEALWQFTRLDMPVDLTPSGPVDVLELGQGMLPVMGPLLRWRQVTLQQFAARFQDPLLREALPQLFQFVRPDCPMMMMLTALANMNDREAGYPIGGSLQFAQDLARRYEALGGEICYRSRVQEILARTRGPVGRRGGNDFVVGVRLADGTPHYGDIVISAADGHSTIFHLLGGNYAGNKVRSYYSTLSLGKSILQISLGVAQDFTGEPPALNFPLQEPVLLGNTQHDRLVVQHYCFDRTMAPPGKSVLSLWCETDYDHWARLRADLAQYREAKDRVAQQAISALEKRYPGISAQVEAVDVATPVTYERYTGNWRGAFAGWALTTRKMSIMMGGGMSKTLPALDDFYMIGQWVEPGGNVELSAGSGRDVIKDICKSQGRPFKTRRETV